MKLPHFLLGIFLLAPQVAVSLPSPSPDQLVEQVQKAWDQIKSYQAEFVQTIYSKTLGTREETKGTISVLKPLKLRWESPSKQTLQILNGKELWQIRKSKRRKQTQVEHYPDISQWVDLKSLSFLADQTNIKKSYKYQVVKDAPEALTLALIPKAGGEETLLAEIRKPGYYLGALKIESAGSETQITFSEVKTNVSFKDSWFEYQPGPQDVVHKHTR